MKALQSPFLRSWSRLWPLVCLLLLAAPCARAQVVDDSTKVLYGPKTTRVIYEAEVLRDSTSGTPLDTTLTKWPQARFWFHDTTFQQDLGTVGSASRPLLYQPNLELGARFGRNAFDKYARDARTVPYYDSRSPYSFFRVVQSGAGEQVFEISYSRSLKKNFSVGVAYERIASNKVLAPAKGSRDGLVEHSNLLFFGRYQNDNERYHLLFNFSNVRHRALEQGGIKPLEGENTPQDLFKYREQQVWLTQAANNEDRDELYLTQTYRLLGRGLTVYHTFDAKRQYNSFADLGLETVRASDGSLERSFFPSSFNSPTATIDRAEYRQVENTIGVLGRTKAVEYRLYARDRDASLVSQTLLTGSTTANLMLRQPVPSRLFNQFFVGGTAAFNYRTIYAVETAGEVYLLPLSGLSSSNFSPEYWFRGNVRTGPLSAEVLVNSYSPTLTQQEFIGNHYAWSHWSGNYISPATNAVDGTFDKNISTQQFTGRLQLKLPSLGLLTGQRFEASVSGVNIANLVYYGTTGAPQQLGTNRNLVIVFARHRTMLGRVGFDNQVTYTKGDNDSEGLRIPSLVTNSRVFFESYIFHKALFNQIGAEVYYQSAFRGYTYNPTAQQFYQQDHFTIGAHAIADVFFVADIKTVSIFLKIAYVNQGLNYNGYYASPFYTGYPRRLQLGVKWNFFN
ncbi:putative porin [Hymenobacter siberiensis]|uniref:putative porin n=1 Tax=Hymenobacter siberiensis TaxID=2848396 RepID=UPI001C1E5CA3|nr:putative porin [Hymenobacter siberiensis]